MINSHIHGLSGLQIHTQFVKHRYHNFIWSTDVVLDSGMEDGDVGNGIWTVYISHISLFDIVNHWQFSA